MEFLTEWGFLGLFIASFLAATILPFSSEIVLTGVLAAGLDPLLCVLYATAGNSLGGMTCYYVGTLGKMEWIEKYFKIKAEKVKKMQLWLYKKGSWTAFFVFLPGIGDVIAIALGFMRANVLMVFIAMTLGKLLRYWVVVWGVQEITKWFV